MPKKQKPKPQNPKPGKPSQIKLALFALGILILLLVIGKFLTFLISLQKPITSELNTTKTYSWNKKSVYNVAFIQHPNDQNPAISVVSFQPTEQKAVVLHLSANIYSEVAKGYGTWRLGSVYQLGQEESPKKGASLLKLSLTRLLAIPIDAVVFPPDSTKYEDTEQLLTSFRKNVIPDFLYLSRIESDLTKWEALEFYYQISKVRADKIDSLNFERSAITESKLLPDSSRVLGVNTVRLDLFIREKLADPTITRENIPVAIFNATEQTGLAQELARFVTNIGGNVIIVQNMENKQLKSTVTVTNQSHNQIKNTVTYQRLSQFMAPDCLKRVCELEDDKIADSRAVINVVIGADYVRDWYEK